MFSNINIISNSSNNDLSFSNNRYLNDLKNIKAKACIINEDYIKFLPNNCKPIIAEILFILALISDIFSELSNKLLVPYLKILL